MKKITIIAAFLVTGVCLFAQTTITGNIKDQSGDPIVGASVFVKSQSSIGTIANAQGTYTLTIPGNIKASVLIFSFIGMETVEMPINGRTRIDVILNSSIILFDDVVVTALGVSRQERSLGYAVQEVSSDDVAVPDPTSVVNSLQGRVAGVQIKSGAGTVGGSSNVIIRGISSLGGSNQPLYVVDGTPISNYNISGTTDGYDFGNGAQDINPDNVASVSVLKGAAATTLYGSRGANGVIIVTTKSGSRKNGLGVEVNSTTTFDNVYILPEFQNEYGGGSSLEFPTFDYAESGLDPQWSSMDGTSAVQTGTDESWGPKFDGRQVLHWDSFVPESKNYMKTRPWKANPDNYKNIFDTGVTLSNSINIQSANDNSSFRISYTNLKQTGVVPTSELQKNMFGVKGSSKLSDNVEVFASVNYIKQKTKGRSRFGYSGDGESVPGAMRIWTQRQVDADLLRKHYYSNIMGQQVGWNFRDISDGRTYIRWSNNPFWVLNNIYAKDAKDRLYGHAGFKINIIDGLSFTGTARTDYYTMNTDERIGSGGTTTDYYGESRYTSFENNYEGIINYNKRFGSKWSASAVLGGNIMYSQYRSAHMNTVDGLVVENFFSIANSSSPVEARSYFSEKQINSVFASASMGYANTVYLDLSARNDWSSTLPPGNQSYFYPAISTSFVFSELMDVPMLSFGKLRAGYALVGNDTSPYQLYNAYSNTNFGPTTTFTVSNTRLNPNLKNELTKEFELGLEATFFNNRLGADLTYFDRKSTELIFDIDVSSTTGYSTAVINAGELQNKGFEVTLYGTPVKAPDFTWDISLNYSSYKTQLNSLYGDLSDLTVSDVGSAWVKAEVGGKYGQMYASGGYDYYQGQKLVDEEGYFMQSGEPEKVGDIMPDFNGGMMNTFKFKGITLSALIDFQKGGLIYSWANRWATKAGQTPITVGLNDKGNPKRDDVADGGGMRSDGLIPTYASDGVTIVSTRPNNVYISAKTYYNHAKSFNEDYMYDASFVKLRELKLGYTLPKEWTGRVMLQEVTISVVARNVALLHSNTEGFDPEVVNSTSNASLGYEGGSLPSSRSVGFNVNLKF